MDINLTHKNAVICGSTQGIGLAAARGMAVQGANVTLVARSEEKLKEAVRDLPQSDHQKHRYIVADFNDPFALKAKMETY
ncbi:MAG: SDR family NAD(P)-dependent oxidoreductase, partial [Sinomicrobium sp.]|nr:SDR family NAD(P)-dependent oxidoreductase [Sinomicrobium sp.]